MGAKIKRPSNKTMTKEMTKNKSMTLKFKKKTKISFL